MIKYLGWFIILGCFSCQKDNMNSPVSVQFMIDMDRSVGTNNNIQFLQGDIWLDKFLFSGLREEGEDVNFSVSYTNGDGVGVGFSTLFIPQLLFDIPEGSYNDIEVKLLTAGSIQSSVDLSVEGNYQQNGNNIPIRIEIDEAMQLKAEIDAEIVTLSEGNEIQEARFEVQPLLWFDNISTAMLDSATLIPVNNVATILINEEHNVDLYNQLIDQVNESNLVSFD